MITNIAVALLSLACAGLLGASVLTFYQNQLAMRRYLAIQARRANDVQKRRMDRLELRNRKTLMEDSVREGTTAVEAIHRTITGVTFDLVDRYSRSEELKAKAKKAREVHDESTRTFYKAVRTTNRALHVVADIISERQAGPKDRKGENKPD
ncbi:hypothetical protein [Marinobacter mobilis]|uniref:Uncharacterized protein n=1 Tax=Marinobacter mobilis TaxID=488533 RepID=A0A1H2VBE7_9GAMM|nr:hypothetical protein [Marinobacter mobilis]SDW65623.1 hypothetical protein SAMN04487960_103395 [Marinobacter mobilis]